MSIVTPDLPVGLRLMAVEDAAGLKYGSRILMYDAKRETLKFWTVNGTNPFGFAIVDDDSDGDRSYFLNPNNPAKEGNRYWPVVADGPEGLSTLLRYSVKT